MKSKKTLNLLEAIYKVTPKEQVVSIGHGEDKWFVYLKNEIPDEQKLDKFLKDDIVYVVLGNLNPAIRKYNR